MARRNKQSVFEDLIDVTALMPWWMGAVLAFVSYFMLHALATRPAPVMATAAQVSDGITHVFFGGLAMIGQYLLPFAFSLGALVSFFKRRKAGQLHDSAARRADGIASMSWREFEALVGEFFRRQGYSVVQQGGAGPDGGVDVLLQKGSDRYLVQCKHWRALRVGVQPVRELYGVMAARRVAGGFVVTSGEFTEEARRFAEGREIQLIEGNALQRGVRAQAAPAPASRATGNRPMPIRPEELAPMAEPAARSTPSCPLCSAPMVLRQARNGAAPGKQFWGCSSYAQTKCRGTRELAS